MKKNDSIVFGGGCFWCTEAVFNLFEGVIATEPGYAGGTTKNPTYHEICEGTTGHAEVLKVDYDPKKISFEKLLDIFFNMHEPTLLNRQGGDVGTQYRSIVLYNTLTQKKQIEKFISEIQKKYSKPIVTEVKKLDIFYPAEEYHKRYYEKNPYQPYCGIVIGHKIDMIKKKYNLK